MGPARRNSPNAKPMTVIATRATADKILATGLLLAFVKVANRPTSFLRIFVFRCYHFWVEKSTYSWDFGLRGLKIVSWFLKTSSKVSRRSCRPKSGGTSSVSKNPIGVTLSQSPIFTLPFL